MKNQVNFPSGSNLTEEGFDPISSMAQMSQHWSNGVTLSGMGEGPMGPPPMGPSSMGPGSMGPGLMGPGPMGSGPMNPGMENQVPFPPLDFTIPECSKPIHSPMSQQWSEGVTSSGIGRGPMGSVPMGPGQMGSGPMGPCPMGNLMAKVNAMKITTNNQTLEQVYAVQTEAARAESHIERAQYLDTNCAHIDYTMDKAMEMSLNIPTE